MTPSGIEPVTCRFVALKRVWKGKQGETSKVMVKVKAKVKIALEQATKAKGGVEVIAVLFL